jgi:hypothetical protein
MTLRKNAVASTKAENIVGLRALEKMTLRKNAGVSGRNLNAQ